MAVIVDPKSTTRAAAYELWMKAPNPMVTFFKTMDVTNLIRISKKRKLKFNMLLDYCIGKAAVDVKEFYILPVGNELIQYDTIAVNTIVKNKDGEVSSCDIIFTQDLDRFNQDYLCYTAQVAATMQDRDLSENCMVIGNLCHCGYADRWCSWYEQRYFQQSLYDLGQVQEKVVPVLPANFLSISPYPDGWCPCRKIPGESTNSH